jgi:hypothetical protein
MHWCELNGVDFLFGLAKNVRLTAGDRCRISCRAPAQRANRQAGTALQGLYLVDAG